MSKHEIICVHAVVNIWVQHRGMRMLFVDKAGGLTEMSRVEEPWRFWLGSKKLRETTETFEQRLTPESLAFYRQLQGQSGSTQM